MDPNTHSAPPPELIEQPQPSLRTGALEPLGPLGPPGPVGPPGPAGPLGELAGLVAAVEQLAAEDLDGLTDAALNQQTLVLQGVLDCLGGQVLRRVAAVDGRGAAGADRGQPAPSTSAWLRRRTRMSASAAHDTVRTARALFRGPLAETAQALVAGVISPAHARVLAQGTRHLPDQVTRAAEPVLVEAAARLDPPMLRQAVGHLLAVADPDRADGQAQHRHERRGLWLSPTIEDMVAVNGLLEPEAGAIVRAALEPLARPADADDTRLGGQRTADALAEVCRRSLEGGWLPKGGGVRPQLLVTVDLDSLLGHPEGLQGDLGWAGPLDQEACRRLACDGAITRVVVSRHPGHRNQVGVGVGLGHDPSNPAENAVHDPGADHDPGAPEGLQEQLRAAMAGLPPTLGGAPSQPLDLGRSTRVISPAQRSALAVRDRGCVFPGCDRPLAWCDAHHLWHWADGGPTDLANLALLCRAHHRAVHEGGWQLTCGPDGRFTASPGPPAGRGHRRQRPPPAA